MYKDQSDDLNMSWNDRVVKWLAPAVKRKALYKLLTMKSDEGLRVTWARRPYFLG